MEQELRPGTLFGTFQEQVTWQEQKMFSCFVLHCSFLPILSALLEAQCCCQFFISFCYHKLCFCVRRSWFLVEEGVFLPAIVLYLIYGRKKNMLFNIHILNLPNFLVLLMYTWSHREVPGKSILSLEFYCRHSHNHVSQILYFLGCSFSFVHISITS